MLLTNAMLMHFVQIEKDLMLATATLDMTATDGIARKLTNVPRTLTTVIQTLRVTTLRAVSTAPVTMVTMAMVSNASKMLMSAKRKPMIVAKIVTA